MSYFLYSLLFACCCLMVQGTSSPSSEDKHTIVRRQADELIVSFTEGDYDGDEEDGSIPVFVLVQGEITENLTIILTPRQLTLPSTASKEERNEEARRPSLATADRDFNSTPITVVLPPSIGVIQVKVPIPIIPDTINEVNQEFAVDLQVVDRPFTSTRSTTTVRIVDNDAVIFVWEFPSYTFEETFTKSARIVKAQNTSTELELTFVIQAVQPNVENFATFRVFTDDAAFGTEDTSIRDLIKADENEFTAIVIITSDKRFEGDQIFELRIQNDDDQAPFSTEINGVNRDTAVITIVDTIELGFVQTFINVTEDQGSVKICIEENGPINSSLLSTEEIEKIVHLGIVTVNGSAVGGEDFTEHSKVDDQVVLVAFKPVGDSHCFFVNITDDDVPEDTEEFNVTLNIGVNDPILLKSVILKPKVVTIRIIDNDDDLIPVIVNDTVIGDPLLTVPVRIINLESENITSNLSLCFELHGDNNVYFNLVSDECVSVNSHYSGVGIFNIIDEIAVKAVDETGECRDILVSLKPDGCATSIDGIEVDQNMARNGVSVRIYSNRVRISVPNCDKTRLVMWVICLNQTLQGYNINNDLVSADARMMKYVIARGFNLRETSHGILGQFWNIPVIIHRYNGPVAGLEGPNTYYNVTVMHPDSSPRSFPGYLWSVSWEFFITGEQSPCLYSGTKNAGPTSEIAELSDSVIEGFYLDYATGEPFGTNFKYSRFSNNCSAKK